MKVHELIDLLERADRNAHVVIDDCLMITAVDGIAWDGETGDVIVAVCTSGALRDYEHKVTPDSIRRTNDAIMGVLAGEEELEHSTSHDDEHTVDGNVIVISTVEL